ncbi:MAG: ABC transporter substrate-binding protein, partial [Psychrobium sp.]
MEKFKIWLLVIGILLSFSMNASTKEPQPLHLYLDADFTTMSAAANAIELGINTALSEEAHKINGYQIKIIRKNHRGNSRRSTKHLQQFIEDKNAIAVFGGLHSPPLLSNKTFINQHQILTLVPWAAAGPITRSTNSENWIFRLSIDDSNAGEFIINQALKQGFKRPY